MQEWDVNSFTLEDVEKVKARYWGAIFYPESLPRDWKDFIEIMGLPIAVSPLHNLDLDKEGNLKKEHYHVIFAYSNTTTFDMINRICVKLNQPFPIPLHSIKGAYEYLWHKNSPDKAQYNSSEVFHLNGFNIADFFEYTHNDVRKGLLDIKQFIFDNGILEYAHLVDLCSQMEDFFWFDLVTSRIVFFTRLLSSVRNGAKRHGTKLVFPVLADRLPEEEAS